MDIAGVSEANFVELPETVTCPVVGPEVKVWVDVDALDDGMVDPVALEPDMRDPDTLESVTEDQDIPELWVLELCEIDACILNVSADVPETLE